MNFNEEDIRSDVGFVCIGQAAGNIGLLFEEKGYNVLYINTSSEDLALLKNAIKDGKRHVITDRLLVFGRTDFFKK